MYKHDENDNGEIIFANSKEEEKNYSSWNTFGTLENNIN